MLICGTNERVEDNIKLEELHLREFVIKKSTSKQTAKQKIGERDILMVTA